MAEKKMSLGQAIDAIVEALEALEPNTRQTAIAAACTHLNIKLTESQVRPTASVTNIPTPEAITPPVGTSRTQVDIRTLKEEKAPKSAVQMACVVAFYLQELAPLDERKQTVNTNDLDKYFKQAKFPLPKALSQLLPDARVAGYFDSAAAKGEYSLNAVGYNLVAHNLPPKQNK